MLKLVLVTTVCLGILATSGCTAFGVSRNSITSNSKTEELTTTTSTSDRVPAGYFLPHNIPKVEEGCKIEFRCKKKLKNAENPKPCVKFCAETIVCENGKRSFAPAGQCVELNEAMVMQEYNNCKNEENVSNSIMPVAMIDFPCQPGYLPDERGRCREIW